MVKYKINTIIVRLSAILAKIEIFVLFNFFFSSVNKEGYFNVAISFLWLRWRTDKKTLSYNQNHTEKTPKDISKLLDEEKKVFFLVAFWF